MTKNKIKYQNKDQYKNDSYGKTSRSKERDYLYDEDDIFQSEIERVYKVLQTMSQEKEMALAFMVAFSENPDKILDSIHSPADVDHLIAERIECGRNQNDTHLKTKDPHVNISNTSSQNYESINAGLELTQESVDTEIIEESDRDSEEEIHFLDLDECEIIDELDFRELEQIPHVMVKLTEGQVLEEFMLEEEIEFQEMDKCIVELPDKQEIDREMVVLPKMPIRTACEQKVCIEEEIFNRSLPELCKAQESIHKADIQLETPKVNTMEISALPREIKLEKQLEQSKSKWHTKRKKVLASKLVRRANSTELVKREVCRPPPKPPDR